ncbi:MAG: DUF4389 domain-containing protein [bacterium]|nr:DUF4389 domain-containing protein [bacterium]
MSYPAAFDVETPDRMANWRPLVQWLMALPHVLVMYVLGIVGFVVAVVSWFSIVFTGKLSESLAATQSMVLRYSMRTTAFAGFLHEEFPPFDFTSSTSEPGGTPVTVDFTPALENRNRLTVALRIFWLIPAAIFGAIVLFVAEILWFLAFFAVLFTGSWPEGLRDFVVKALRINVRVNAYGALLTDEYPPFALD